MSKLHDESSRVEAAEQPLIPEPKMATLMRSFVLAAENARDVVLRIMIVKRVRVMSAVNVVDSISPLANTTSPVHCRPSATTSKSRPSIEIIA